jgi:hypothetical protein
MALDWGLYSAFRTQPRLEQRAQLEAQNLNYLKELNVFQQQKNQERRKNDLLIREHMKKFSEIEGLDRDRNNLLKIAKSEEANIIKGIAKSGGDATKYLNTGGIAQLYAYFNNVKSSQEMANLKQNKQHQVSYYEALQKGEMAIPLIHKDKEGNEQILDFPTAMEKYNDGEIGELTWKGSQKPVEIDPLKISKIPNPTGMHGRNVSTKEYYNMLIAKGQNPLIAEQMQKRADPDGTGKVQGLYWGPRTNLMKAMMQGKKGSKGSKAKSFEEAERDIYSEFQTGGNQHKGDMWINQVTNEEGQEIDPNSLGIGEAAYVNQIHFAKSDNSALIKKTKELMGLTGVKAGSMMSFGEGMKYRPVGMNEEAQIMGDAKGEYKVSSIRPIINTTGAYVKNEAGQLENKTNGRGGFLVSVMMTDEQAGKFGRTNLQTGDFDPYYNKNDIFIDTPGTGAERAFKETEDDDDMIEMTFTIDAPADAFTAYEVGKAYGQDMTELLPYYQSQGQQGLENMAEAEEVLRQDPALYAKLMNAGYSHAQVLNLVNDQIYWGGQTYMNPANYNSLTD